MASGSRGYLRSVHRAGGRGTSGVLKQMEGVPTLPTQARSRALGGSDLLERQRTPSHFPQAGRARRGAVGSRGRRPEPGRGPRGCGRGRAGDWVAGFFQPGARPQRPHSTYRPEGLSLHGLPRTPQPGRGSGGVAARMHTRTHTWEQGLQPSQASKAAPPRWKSQGSWERAPGLGALALPRTPSSPPLAPGSPFPRTKCQTLWNPAVRGDAQAVWGGCPGPAPL